VQIFLTTHRPRKNSFVKKQRLARDCKECGVGFTPLIRSDMVYCSKRCHKKRDSRDRAVAYRANARLWYANNKQRVIDYQKEYVRKNKIKSRAWKKKWVQANPDKVCAKTAQYNAKKIQRTPPWLTALHLQQIENFYTRSCKLTKETGVQHSVDHIVPLQGKLVSGLHVPWNLQILTAVENSAKGNKFEIKSLTA